LLLFLILGFGWGLLRGGSLHCLINHRLRWSGSVLVALLLQLIVFSPLGKQWTVLEAPVLHVASYILLAIFVGANIQHQGFWLMGAGLLSNLVVIVANGGYMPTPSEHLAWLGLAEDSILNNSTIIHSGTVLWWLGDIFLLPLPAIGNVFSIGDVALGVGVAYFAYHAMEPIRPFGKQTRS